LINVDYIKTGQKPEKKVAIVLQLASKGNLLKYLDFKGKFDEKLARTYFAQLIEGKIKFILAY
jgi:hypothetical protein